MTGRKRPKNAGIVTLLKALLCRKFSASRTVLLALLAIAIILLTLKLRQKTPIEHLPPPKLSADIIAHMDDLMSKQSYIAKSTPEYTKSTGKSRVNIVTLHLIEPKDIGQVDQLINITLPNKIQYAKRHGYRLVEAADYPLVQKHRARGVPIFFLKLLCIMLALEDENPEWIMWMDADAFFLNHSRSLEEHLDTRYDVVINAVGKPPNFARVPNNGVYFVQNTPWARNFFYSQWIHAITNPQSCPFDVNDKPVNENHPQSKLNGWLRMCWEDGRYWLSDQGLFIVTMLAPPRSLAWRGTVNGTVQCHIKFVANRDFNSILGWYQSGDLIFHTPGQYGDVRAKILREFWRLTDWNTGTVRWEESEDLILKPDFKQEIHSGTRETAVHPLDPTDSYPGKHGWFYNEAPCSAAEIEL
ncbi:hypothetical protein SmJEL517_g04254 [Synchytrium microbalum]|uniref:Nucleotide-diphospho-sugar transferase domain-containing protein n=1 Tax=Synchytrium microbalum TaxID=1806994 RepID=A0A507C3R6_9FUNG|nr:uncharacterized protein SmJEL517_g04254 [Synchytrium microbalum]TPX32754.1 hypothetical protein SmJEL517_g04254 [Synchytrium microbalum]